MCSHFSLVPWGMKTISQHPGLQAKPSVLVVSKWWKCCQLAKSFCVLSHQSSDNVPFDHLAALGWEKAACWWERAHAEMNALCEGEGLLHGASAVAGPSTCGTSGWWAQRGTPWARGLENEKTSVFCLFMSLGDAAKSSPLLKEWGKGD